MVFLILLLFAVLIVQAFLARRQANKIQQLEDQNIKILGQKKSSEVRTGQIAEQMAPFLANFPYNPKQAHFIGMPIDYVVFTDDEVVFLEVKSGQSSLSKKQQQIKEHIQIGKVTWVEYRIEGQTPSPQPSGIAPDIAIEIPLDTLGQYLLNKHPLLAVYTAPKIQI